MLIDGRDQSLGRQAPGLGDQRPGVVDGLFLEIVAEGEIPQHFKESMVPRRIADIVEVVVLAPRAHAFLRRHRGAVRSEEHTSELQSLMRLSYAVFCLKKKKPKNKQPHD